jgi:photosystem II stability/assembly factor-like uncharacterized protein
MAVSAPRSTAAANLVVAARDGLHGPGHAAPLLAGRRIDALAVDGDTVWAVVDGTELHRVGRDGSAQRAATLVDGVATSVHVHGGTVWIGGDRASLGRLRDDGLEPVATFVGAPTRAEWYTPWGGPPSVLSMASHGDDLYVGVHVGGILRTADDGHTWHDTIDLHVDVHQVAVDPVDGVVWAATGERGLARSPDRGASWTYLTAGLHGTYCLAVAVTDAGVLAGASSGHAGRDGALYRLGDDDRLVRAHDGLPDRLDGAIQPGHLVGRGRAAAVVLPGGRVATTDDGGRHWTVLDGMADVTAIGLR